VRNRGCIPEAVRAYLFDPFRSARGDAQRSEGLGLGLYIVDQIVQAHGGRVEVLQPDAASTEFRVVLPRR
jgi:two-component system, sensor histidine kinase and response regulator